jgi:hypothetical protein
VARTRGGHVRELGTEMMVRTAMHSRTSLCRVSRLCPSSLHCTWIVGLDAGAQALQVKSEQMCPKSSGCKRRTDRSTRASLILDTARPFRNACVADEADAPSPWRTLKFKSERQSCFREVDQKTKFCCAALSQLLPHLKSKFRSVARPHC